eukprot:COSAG01_NODE_59059_length_302_cov_1.000000_1_plen_100_part_11
MLFSAQDHMKLQSARRLTVNASQATRLRGQHSLHIETERGTNSIVSGGSSVRLSSNASTTWKSVSGAASLKGKTGFTGTSTGLSKLMGAGGINIALQGSA